MNWQPTPVFLPRNPMDTGARRAWNCKESDTLGDGTTTQSCTGFVISVMEVLL